MNEFIWEIEDGPSVSYMHQQSTEGMSVDEIKVAKEAVSIVAEGELINDGMYQVNGVPVGWKDIAVYREDDGAWLIPHMDTLTPFLGMKVMIVEDNRGGIEYE
jgi:hypothetical protein